ncbi:L(+)-tartrate dehydratase subunit alpha [bioreactor metagenome]|uniref:L(+)-tartrate dehydratase subunit alpha n=1 Tax=bioreactor metagenome TaxID=1076179 RepID=A0A645AS70_9ZZZZ|nr:fumarate hydratase [Oscillospiraceae bacterium]
MRTIKEETIIAAVSKMLADINYSLSPDVCRAVAKSEHSETNPTAKKVLGKLIDNMTCAHEENVPICQDTGMAVIFLEIGTGVRIDSPHSMQEICDIATERAYTRNFLRLSVVADPLRRVNTHTNAPAVVYTELVAGDIFKITVSPKGFGSENMSKIKMFTPSAAEDDIINFIVYTVFGAGSNPCPPVVVGVGIGGTFDYCAVLAKKALTIPLDVPNPDPFYAEMEQKTLDRLNTLCIGPQGFGGDTTALAVKILPYPTHIAGLPVAVNINCHVCRHISKEI